MPRHARAAVALAAVVTANPGILTRAALAGVGARAYSIVEYAVVRGWVIRSRVDGRSTALLPGPGTPPPPPPPRPARRPRGWKRRAVCAEILAVLEVRRREVSSSDLRAETGFAKSTIRMALIDLAAARVLAVRVVDRHDGRREHLWRRRRG